VPPAPASVELPRAVGHPHQQQRTGVVTAYAREHEQRAVAERGEQPLEVVARPDREPVAFGDGGEDPHEPVEVARLLGHDRRALRLVDVLPRLLAHRREHLVVGLREVHQERAPRLDEDRRRADAGTAEAVTHGRVVPGFRIAEETRAAFFGERVAHRGDRRGEVFGRDQRTARRVGDRQTKWQRP
jgi:hypothetical protein